MSDVISFDEIVSCATVRVTIIDGVQYLSIRDMIMHLCDKNSNNAGGVWRDFSDDKKNEVQDFILNFQFPGRGQSVQPVITFPGALKLARTRRETGTWWNKQCLLLLDRAKTRGTIKSSGPVLPRWGRDFVINKLWFSRLSFSFDAHMVDLFTVTSQGGF